MTPAEKEEWRYRFTEKAFEVLMSFARPDGLFTKGNAEEIISGSVLAADELIAELEKTAKPV